LGTARSRNGRLGTRGLPAGNQHPGTPFPGAIDNRGHNPAAYRCRCGACSTNRECPIGYARVDADIRSPTSACSTGRATDPATGDGSAGRLDLGRWLERLGYGRLTGH
jgi:hypothetical protein